MTPLCFVLMPFGMKRDPAGRPDIDFNRIYQKAIAPGIAGAGLEPIRADEEVTAGIIHTAMFERLLLCDFAVADLTTANANVFYELGVRHAVRPRTTLMVFADHHPIPFDVKMLRAESYSLGENNAFTDSEAEVLREKLRARMTELRKLAQEGAVVDSPLPALLQGYGFPDLAHLKTDVFRERVAYSKDQREALAAARCLPKDEARAKLLAIEQSLTPLDGVESGVLIDLFLSHRAIEAYDAMVDLCKRLPEVLRRTVLVREQLGFARNRLAGKAASASEKKALRDRAICVLKDVISERGPSSETCGILGRIYKDIWDEARMANAPSARGNLKVAIAEYIRGFEADWKDAYPGINAVTLLEVEGSKESLSQRDRLVPVVRFSVEQRLRGKIPDYWDHATLLELAVLGRDQAAANSALDDALAAVREGWEPKTTARNLGIIRDARAARGEDVRWVEEIIEKLASYGASA